MTWLGLPTDEAGLYRWITVLAVGYLVISYALSWHDDRELFSDRSYRIMLPKLFDSLTFSASVMLLLGEVDEDVLKAIGSTKPFLLMAGLAGVLHGLHALKTLGKR